MERELRRTQTAYTIFLGILTLAVGLLFLLTLADIYTTGADASGDMYSYAGVGERLLGLLAPVAVWIVAVIGGFIVTDVYPRPEKRRRPDLETSYRRLRSRIPAGEGEEFARERNRVRVCERVRIAAWLIALGMGILSAVMCAVYLFDASRYVYGDIGLNGVVIALLKHIAPWVGAAFFACLMALVVQAVCARAALPRVKRLIVLGKGLPLEGPSPWEKRAAAVRSALGSKWSILAFRLALIAVGVLFVVIGALNGGAWDVLVKAVNICTECIGLG